MKYIIVIFISFTFSCKKFVDINPAPGIIESATVFNDQQTALEAMMGVYTNMRFTTQRFSNAGLHIFAALTADELKPTTPLNNYEEFYTNSLLPTNYTLYNNYWMVAYKNIYHINAVIEGVTRSTGINDSIKKLYRAEMLFNRAWYYFQLINTFGEVPLITTTNYQVNTSMPRTAINTIYEQIIKDLIEAKEGLNNNYPSSGKVRPNRWTASAFLSRVYLYTENWIAAETEAAAVINCGVYSHVTDLNKVFLINSPETIWEVAANNGNTAQAGLFIPLSPTSLPNFALTSTLLNAFETNDQRKTHWTNVNGQQYYYPFKYKNKSASPVTEYNVMIRLAEVTLIRAEARARQNNLAAACDDINIIRSRAGLQPFSSSIKELVLAAIDKERRTELFTEWGHRWMDLKRNEQADTVLAALKGSNWQPTDKRYPIPQAELDNNPFLVQNNGY